MKRCIFCGGEYPDQVTVCPLDRQPLYCDELLDPVVAQQESIPIGTALDVSTIAPLIQEVRRDHAAALRAHPHPASHRVELLALARQAIAALPFFHHEKSDDKYENRNA